MCHMHGEGRVTCHGGYKREEEGGFKQIMHDHEKD